jgi:hypothetical protein
MSLISQIPVNQMLLGNTAAAAEAISRQLSAISGQLRVARRRVPAHAEQ